MSWIILRPNPVGPPAPYGRKSYLWKLMKWPKDKIKRNGLLKWLTTTILLFGLITFSGYVSESRHYNAGSTKTELNEAGRVSFKRTVYLKKASNGLSYSLFHSTRRTENFSSALFHQKTRITVKLKNNLKERPTKERKKSFLLYYSFDCSEGPGTIRLRG